MSLFLALIFTLFRDWSLNTLIIQGPLTKMVIFQPNEGSLLCLGNALLKECIENNPKTVKIACQKKRHFPLKRVNIHSHEVELSLLQSDFHSFE